MFIAIAKNTKYTILYTFFIVIFTINDGKWKYANEKCLFYKSHSVLFSTLLSLILSGLFFLCMYEKH